uniref:Uncharacterized protein n=1 Tax=Oryza rufipogon TaxID=4529 RepID=A0A0E0RE19_ORYRU
MVGGATETTSGARRRASPESADSSLETEDSRRLRPPDSPERTAARKSSSEEEEEGSCDIEREGGRRRGERERGDAGAGGDRRRGGAVTRPRGTGAPVPAVSSSAWAAAACSHRVTGSPPTPSAIGTWPQVSVPGRWSAASSTSRISRCLRLVAGSLICLELPVHTAGHRPRRLHAAIFCRLLQLCCWSPPHNPVDRATSRTVSPDTWHFRIPGFDSHQPMRRTSYLRTRVLVPARQLGAWAVLSCTLTREPGHATRRARPLNVSPSTGDATLYPPFAAYSSNKDERLPRLARTTSRDGCIGLRRPPPRRHLCVSDIGIDFASTSSSCPRIIGLITRSSARLRQHLAANRLRLRIYAIKLRVAAASPLGPQCRCPWSTPPLVVAVLRGALLSMATSSVDFSSLHRHGAAAVLSSRTAASPLCRLHRRSRIDNLVVRTGHRQPLRVFFLNFEHRRRISKLPLSPL